MRERRGTATGQARRPSVPVAHAVDGGGKNNRRCVCLWMRVWLRRCSAPAAVRNYLRGAAPEEALALVAALLCARAAKEPAGVVPPVLLHVDDCTREAACWVMGVERAGIVGGRDLRQAKASVTYSSRQGRRGVTIGS